MPLYPIGGYLQGRDQVFHKGSCGRVAAGAQWEHIQRKSFDTIAGNGISVSTSDNVFMTSLRYYPF